MEMFIINGTDYTNHIMVPSYKVQSEPVTETWEDVRYRTHADLKRWKVRGSFKIFFDDISELQSFLAALENARGVDNFTDATLYDNYKMQKHTSKYFFKISLVQDYVYYGNKKHDGYEIQVEEQ